MKSLKLILVIIFASVVSTFMIVEVYSYGYMVTFIISILFLFVILGLNRISGRNLSINVKSVSLIITYILISLSFIISSDLDFLPRVLINLILLEAINIELTSEFISSSVFLKYLKAFAILVVSRLIGIFGFIKYLGNNTFKSNNKVANSIFNIIILLSTVFFLLGAFLYISGFLFPHFYSQFNEYLYSFISNSNGIVVTYIYFFIPISSILFLYFGTELVFINKLSGLDFKLSEMKVNTNIQKSFVTFIQILTILLNISLIITLIISITETYAGFLESIRFNQILFLSAFGITLFYFLKVGLRNFELNNEFSKFIRINSMFIGILSISVLLVTFLKLTQHEAILGFTQNRIYANLLIIVLIILIIYLIIPVLNIKRLLNIRTSLLAILIVILGFSFVVPFAYVSNKINLEMYKAGILTEFDLVYTNQYLGYSGDSKERKNYAPNDDGLIVFIDYLKYLKEKNIEYPKIKFFNNRMDGLGRQFTRIDSRSRNFRDFNLFHSIFLEEFRNNKQKLGLFESYDG